MALIICRTSAHNAWGLHEIVDGELKEIDAGALVPLLSVAADRLQARNPDDETTELGRKAGSRVSQVRS